MCTLQTGKLCCNVAINIKKVLVLVYVQKLQENSISCLSWSFVKEFAVSSYRSSYAQLCMFRTEDKPTTLQELHILQNRIGVGLVKSLNQGVWLHIQIHFTPLNE